VRAQPIPCDECRSATVDAAAAGATAGATAGAGASADASADAGGSGRSREFEDDSPSATLTKLTKLTKLTREFEDDTNARYARGAL
jgi:hypothetical protein